MAVKDGTRTTIKYINTYKEKRTWYMSLVAEVEDESRVVEYRFPKIELFSDGRMDVYQEPAFGETSTCLQLESCRMTHRFDCHKGLDEKTKISGDYVAETIKEKTQELTLEEIEKRLGYKVKIVSDKK